MMKNRYSFLRDTTVMVRQRRLIVVVVLSQWIFSSVVVVVVVGAWMNPSTLLYSSSSYQPITTANINKKQPIRNLHEKGHHNVSVIATTASNQDGMHNRRTFLSSSTTTASTVLVGTAFCDRAYAADGVVPKMSAESERELQIGLLDSRVNENILAPPPYGMERSDIIYPDWFQGTWIVTSTTLSVEAPCGIQLFGSNITYANAMKEIGTSLQYESRFIRNNNNENNNNGCIADRGYNVQSIAKAAIGVNSVIDIPLATPNKLTAILAPPGAPSLIQVDLLTVNRRQEYIDTNNFHCSEVSREIVSPIKDRTVTSSIPTQPVLKEIETTYLYTYDPINNQITCIQRSASFLLPSQTNPMQLRKWEIARGRPVDVRFYNVIYTPKKR